MRIEQKEIADATTAETDLNAEYVTKGIDGDVTAVKGQIDRYFVTTIPTGARVTEFNAASTIIQNKFSIISANANAAIYAGVTYLTAWELEYAIMFP